MFALAFPSGRVLAALSAEDGASPESSRLRPSVTNAGQLHLLSRAEFNRGRSMSFTGIVTLVDGERRRLVLQDATGALMWYSDAAPDPELLGKRVRIECPESYAYAAAFAAFPLKPSGAVIEDSFEAPSNWGDYHLTRMSGYLRPPRTGQYRFWIASDDSSELWLSADENPRGVKRIAFVTEGFWTNPHDWDRFPSQHSEPVYLRAGRDYYIEAFEEQAQQDDHLSIAWEGPGIARSVISGAHLRPWAGEAGSPAWDAPAGGVLREYWTNYAVGSVMPISPSGPAGPELTGTGAVIQVIGPGTWPEPRRVDLRDTLPPENNFCWIQAQGIVDFVGSEGPYLTLELAAGPRRVLVRVANWKGHEHELRAGPNWHVQVEGVCESVIDSSGDKTIGLIWVPGPEHVRVLEDAEDPTRPKLIAAPNFPPANSGVGFGGYYMARGAVTFDGAFAGRRYLYVQDIHGSVCVSDVDRLIGNPLEVGQRIQVGGTLSPGKEGLKLVPITLRQLGWESLPVPSQTAPGAVYRDGQWTEVEGVVRSVRADGIITLRERGGTLAVWSPVMEASESLVDSTVRLRGVMTLGISDSPLLLVGSGKFVQIEERNPKNPFMALATPIRDLKPSLPDGWRAHRVKVEGTVTYVNQRIAFLEDDSGAMRVRLAQEAPFQPGERVAVVGFLEPAGSLPGLVEARSLPISPAVALEPKDRTVRGAFEEEDNGRLVRVRGHLITQKQRGSSHLLEFQSGQQSFEVVLSSTDLQQPLVAGSVFDVTGVCVANLIPASGPEVQPDHGAGGSMATWHLFLRTPADIRLLRGPPWWTPRKAMLSVGFLLAALGGTLLWVRFLGRRYDRRQRLRIEFSRRILQSQEAERRRIAANLHDSLGQNLLVIKNQVRLAMQPALDQSALAKRLEDISGMASQVIDEVRQITHDLRPYQLDRVGLTQTLRGTIRRVAENCSVAFASHVDDVDGLFDGNGAIHIYRILQEALNNVVKHSGATEATAVVQREASLVRLVVRDNGRGVASNPQNSQELAHAGFGLSGIDERARILHGKALFDSQPGQGFRLTVEIPLPPQT